MKITAPVTENHTRLQFDRRSVRKTQRFPKTDYNFQPATTADFTLHGSPREKTAELRRPSFRDISCDYFAKETHKSFIAEAVLFVVITATVAVPMIEQWNVLAGLVKALGLR